MDTDDKLLLYPILFLILLTPVCMFALHQLGEKQATRFQHSSGLVEVVSPISWLWCLLFGPFYFFYKGAWGYGLMVLGAGILTLGLSGLIWPFFSHQLSCKYYLLNGWKELPPTQADGS